MPNTHQRDRLILMAKESAKHGEIVKALKHLREASTFAPVTNAQRESVMVLVNQWRAKHDPNFPKQGDMFAKEE